MNSSRIRKQKLHQRGFTFRGLAQSLSENTTVLFFDGYPMHRRTALEFPNERFFNTSYQELCHADSLIAVLSPVKHRHKKENSGLVPEFHRSNSTDLSLGYVPEIRLLPCI